MTREFKFRAWSNKEQKYVESKSLVVSLDGKTVWDENGEVDVILEQYAGTPDCNGVQVYEHDLVQIDADIYEIEWYYTAYWAIPKTGVGSSHPLSFYANSEFEVVGDIHTGKYLLEV